MHLGIHNIPRTHDYKHYSLHKNGFEQIIIFLIVLSDWVRVMLNTEKNGSGLNVVKKVKDSFKNHREWHISNSTVTIFMVTIAYM